MQWIIGKYLVSEAGLRASDVIYAHAQPSPDAESLYSKICLHLHLAGHFAPPPDIAALFPKSRRTGSREAIRIDHARFSGELTYDNAQRTGRFDLAANDPTAFSILLETCVSHCTAQDGGLLLHASGVVKDGRLFLFSGPSESGKTTVAMSLRRNGTPFCVEATGLHIDESGTVVAYPTPLSDFEGEVPLREPMPVHGIAFIQPSSSVSVTPMSPGAAAVSLLHNARYFFDDDADVSLLLGVATRIADGVTCVKMQFVKDETFWDRLEDLLSNPQPTQGR